MGAARVVQTALLGLFTLIGLLGTVAVAIDWVQGLDTWFWQESVCTIESSQAVPRPEYGDTEFQTTYRYFHRGERFLGNTYRHGYAGSELASDAEALAGRYLAGDKVRCWLDPDRPERACLLRSNLWEGFWILVPLLFVAVGGGALWLLHGPALETAEPETSTQPSVPEKAKKGLGVGALILFFGVFFLFGAGFLIPFFIHPALQVVEARSWDATTCEIVSSGVRTHPGDDGATYSIDALFRYEVDGREYRSNRYQFMGGSSSGYERKARVVESLPEGASITCYVNPDDPFEAVIERGFTGDYLFGLIPLVFVLVGIGGLAFAIYSLRRAKKDAALPSWGGAASSAGSSYAWATGHQIEEAETGPISLEPAMGPVGKLGCTILLALLWNGFISIFVWQIIQSWRTGTIEWFVILVVTPFALIGLLLLSGIPYSILALLNPRPRVQLTPGTLRVGESAQLDWAFRGFSGRIRHLKIWLEATETRTRVGDSSASIETRPLDTPDITIVDHGPERTIEYGGVGFTVPDGTPPSSQGEASESDASDGVSVKWTLKLQGDIAYWPDVHEAFEVRVLPATR